jgi:hypothetical protein
MMGWLRAFLVAAVALMLVGVIAPPASGSLPKTGVWYLALRPGGAKAEFGLRIAGADGDSWYESDTVAFNVADYPGLALDQITAPNANVHFTIPRDAGTLDCEGYFRSGVGSGVFAYSANAAFAQALAARGLGVVGDDDQYRLMIADVTIAMVDSLRSRGVSGLSVSSLVQLANHGVDGAYVSSMSATGVKFSSVDALLRLRDHGVDAEYVQGLARYGYHPNADDLVRLRDHGVEVQFVARLKSHGYSPSIEDLIRLKDSGM